MTTSLSVTIDSLNSHQFLVYNVATKIFFTLLLYTSYTLFRNLKEPKYAYIVYKLNGVRWGLKICNFVAHKRWCFYTICKYNNICVH